jgi:hypothetical protein
LATVSTKQPPDKALLQISNLQNLEGPAEGDLHFLQCFLTHNHEPTDEVENTWGNPRNPHSYKPDLVALKARRQEDPTSAFLGNNLGILGKTIGRFMTTSKSYGANVYYEGAIFQFTFWVASALAASLPLVSFVVLTKVSAQCFGVQVGTMAALNALMVFCVNSVTDVKRAELFIVLIM